jgi:hypothetical protein
MPEIVRTQHESRNPTDFVAIGNLLRGSESVHSAFIIQYQSKIFEFHYTGRSIDYGENLKDYYHMETSVIHKDEVPAFIAQCLNIRKKGHPKYGYFYSGESYDLDGNHLSNKDLGEVMTCAGFCLNVLKGFLEADYIEYRDWDNAPFPNPDYVVSFCNQHGLDINKIRPSHRRITPRECLISCKFDQLPIRKAQIDEAQLPVPQCMA